MTDLERTINEVASWMRVVADPTISQSFIYGVAQDCVEGLIADSMIVIVSSV